jgi:signal transduction histidine kinase
MRGTCGQHGSSRSACVNELITNAAKHGTGKIEVTYRIEGDLHELSVCDDGKGLPAGFDPDKSVTGLGMRECPRKAALWAGDRGIKSDRPRNMLYGSLPAPNLNEQPGLADKRSHAFARNRSELLSVK